MGGVPGHTAIFLLTVMNALVLRCYFTFILQIFVISVLDWGAEDFAAVFVHLRLLFPSALCRPLHFRFRVLGLISAILILTDLFISFLWSRVSADFSTDRDPLVHCQASWVYVDDLISILKGYFCYVPLCLRKAYHSCWVFCWKSNVRSCEFWRQRWKQL